MTSNNVQLTSQSYQRIDPERGVRITKAMLAKGLTYNYDLCYDLQVSASTLSRWRHGGPIPLVKSTEICARLEVTLDWLLLGSESVGWCKEQSDRMNMFADDLGAIDDGTRQLVFELMKSMLLKIVR